MLNSLDAKFVCSANFSLDKLVLAIDQHCCWERLCWSCHHSSLG